MRTILHVGCGPDRLPPWFSSPNTQEVRLDIDAGWSPDIIGDMTHLPDGIGPFDAVYSCHSLEHLYPHDVRPCLEGFRRVLKPGGVAIIVVPDLEGIPPTDEVMYHSAEGHPVTGLDMYYGYSGMMRENLHMAHHCGFTQDVMRRVLEVSGFVNVRVLRGDEAMPYALSLLALGYAP